MDEDLVFILITVGALVLGIAALVVARRQRDRPFSQTEDQRFLRVGLGMLIGGAVFLLMLIGSGLTWIPAMSIVVTGAVFIAIGTDRRRNGQTH